MDNLLKAHIQSGVIGVAAGRSGLHGRRAALQHGQGRARGIAVA